MAVNMFKDKLRHAQLFGKPVLAADQPIPRETVPDGWYCYDMRGTGSDPAAHAELVDYTSYYHTGTVLSPKPLKRPTTKARRIGKGKITALVDSDDIHCLMIGAAGVGKTAFFLYPNLEYACACGMSFLALDTKGDLARNYGAIAQKYYGYQVSIIASQKSAIFLVLPEEDQTKNFMAGLMIQNLSHELFSVADENGGKLKNRVVLFCDEFGTMPPFDVLSLFSAGRSRKLTMLPIIQSLAQLEKNYGKEGSEIIQDNCQDTIFGGFAPNSQTAEVLSRALGSYTVQSGSINRGKGENSQSLQMAERALMTPDELKSIPKGEFVVMKTGSHPMRTRLRLFLDWGITFGEPYQVPKHGQRKVYYAGRQELEKAINRRFGPNPDDAKQNRSPQGERFSRQHGIPAHQITQTNQPMVSAFNFAKKQDGPPADLDGG